MADTPTGETVAPVAPSNEPGTVPAPVMDNSNADVEAAKREAEQARIRANQLENEKKALEAKLAEQERQKLEEKEEFKTLYEQTQTRLAEIEAEQADKERKAALETTAQDVLKEYPANVVELAKVAGLSLADDSEESVNAFKEKLDAFKKQIAPNATPSANNPHAPAPAAATKEELLQRMKGGDKAAVNEFIREHPAIKRMKEIANGA